jgi:hypothetical protein
VLVVAIETGGGNMPAGGFSGWTAVATGAVANVGQGMYYRVVTGNEPATYTFSGLNATDSTKRLSAMMVRLIGVNTAAPLDATAVVTAGSAAITSPGITTATKGALVLYMAGIDAATAADISPATGTTLVADTTGTGKRMILASEYRPTAGATGSRSFPLTGTTAGLNTSIITAAFAAAPAPGTGVTLVNTVQAANTGLNDYNITVPTGVTTSHLGIISITVANTAVAAFTVPSGWTVRGPNPGTGGSSGTMYIFSRLGGVSAGQTITITGPANNGGTTTAAWYDTQGRDIASVSSAYNSASADVSSVPFNAPGQSAATDVILVAATRNPVANSWSTPAGTTKDFYGVDAQWTCGAYFGHANNVTSQTYTSTITGGTTHNVETLQFALTAATPAAATPPGTINVVAAGPGAATLDAVTTTLERHVTDQCARRAGRRPAAAPRRHHDHAGTDPVRRDRLVGVRAELVHRVARAVARRLLQVR